MSAWLTIPLIVLPGDSTPLSFSTTPSGGMGPLGLKNLPPTGQINYFFLQTSRKSMISVLSRTCSNFTTNHHNQSIPQLHHIETHYCTISFVQSCLHKNLTERNKGHVTTSKLQGSRKKYWIKVIQTTHFESDLMSLQRKIL